MLHEVMLHGIGHESREKMAERDKLEAHRFFARDLNFDKELLKKMTAMHHAVASQID